MKYFYASLLALILCGCVSNRQASISPPVMFKRTIAPPKVPPPGESFVLTDGDTKFTLYVPTGWNAPASGDVPLTVHFHGAVWFAIQEHLRHGLKTPLIVAYLGEGSSVYRKPFEDRQRFNRWMELAVETLRAHGAPANTRISSVDISSFSAGYSAVRELLKSPEYTRLIRRIILSDSMYASLENNANTLVNTPLGPHCQPAFNQMEPWIPFADAAVRGEKTFVLTCSAVTTSYASSTDCAAALIEAEHAPVQWITPGSSPAASDPEFPLRFRSDVGNFHVWGYGGTSAQAHMTQVRHLADVWMALPASP
jgi:hypothetical protein